MKVDYKNKVVFDAKIVSLVNYLQKADSSSLWNYMGMKVEIDPTADFIDNNVLVRWSDVVEGFNDKVIINSLEEFQQQFQKI